MRVNPVVRALQRSVLRGAAGARPADALTRGLEAAAQAGSSATEFLRVRRDPAEIAIRRRRAAIRRVNIWGAGAAVGLAGGAAVTVGFVNDGFTASAAFSFVLIGALIIWCVLGLIRSVTELRIRGRALSALPPPQPARRPVAAPIRADIGRLDGYSDGLRQLLSPFPAAVDAVGSDLRREVITSADAAERTLRRQAQEYTGARKTMAAGQGQSWSALAGTADDLAGRIRSGVQEYGRLVAAAGDTVAASAQLDRAVTDLHAPTDRLRALAMGMREIADHARPMQAPPG